MNSPIPLFKLLIFAAILFQLLAVQLVGQAIVDTSAINSVFNTFYRDAVIDMTLEVDIDSIIELKNTKTEHPALLRYTDNDGHDVEHAIEVEARGKYRRRVCDIPPIMLEFSKSKLSAQGLENHRKLKLVTHCYEEDLEEAIQDLLKEFLVYKIFNTLSEKSYRAQLVNLTYINTRDNSHSQRPAIILESTAELGERLNGESETIYSIDKDRLDASQYNTVAMFQYMISNTDWHLSSSRNVKTFVSTEPSQKVIVVPYDFDFAGLINSRQAIISPDFSQVDIRERIFLGKFDRTQDLEETVALFLSKEKEILSLCKNFTLLDGKHRRDVKQYLQSFFKILDNEELCQEIFLNNIHTSLSY
jgi:hypothetical protein